MECGPCMKKMFCAGCDMVVAKACFPLGNIDAEVVLKANRLIFAGKALTLDGTTVDLDSANKIAVNRALSEVIVTQNIDADVVCPTCREGVLIAGEELNEPKETKEERLRRASFAPETPGALGHLTAKFIRD